MPVLVRRLQPERERERRGGGDHEQGDDRRPLAVEPELGEREAGREHDRAGRDQRAAMRRRAQQVRARLRHATVRRGRPDLDADPIPAPCVPRRAADRRRARGSAHRRQGERRSRATGRRSSPSPTALVQRAAAVRAVVGERVQLAAVAREHDRRCRRPRRSAAAVGELIGEHVGPASAPSSNVGMVDADALARTPGGRRGSRRRQRRPPASASRRPSAPRRRAAKRRRTASTRRRCWPRERGRSAGPVVAGLAVAPVRVAGRHDRRGAEEADGRSAAASRAALGAAEPVEQEGARQASRSYVGEHRVQRGPSQLAAQGSFTGPARRLVRRLASCRPPSRAASSARRAPASCAQCACPGRSSADPACRV